MEAELLQPTMRRRRSGGKTTLETLFSLAISLGLTFGLTLGMGVADAREAGDGGGFGEYSAAERPSPIAGAPLWRIADADSAVWLLGSMHLLPPNVDWNRPAIDEAIAASEIVYFEAATDASSAHETQSIILSRGLNPPGERLSQRLSPEGRARLARLVRRLGRDLGGVDRLRPWLANLTLEAALFAEMGADVNAGVDRLLERRARERGALIRYLETAAQQVGILSNLPLAVQVAALERALEVFEEDPKIGERLLRAWRRGDDKALTRLVFADSERLPDYYVALFDRRNRVWLDEIIAALDGAETVLMVVGAGHLLGPAGLPALLRARGIAVERR